MKDRKLKELRDFILQKIKEFDGCEDEIFTEGDLMNLLKEAAKEFRLRCNKIVNINKHMNTLKLDIDIDQDVIDAILVAFINHIGFCRGGDYGIYTKDIKEKK